MKVLIDECTPRALKLYLAQHGHKCATVQEAGWSGKVNGDLLALAETTFDVLVTIDTNLQYQQNLSGRKIAIVILLARSNRLELSTHISPRVPRQSRGSNQGMSSTWVIHLEWRIRLDKSKRRVDHPPFAAAGRGEPWQNKPT